MSGVEDLFAYCDGQIEKLRETDGNFNEICSDYDQLARLLESGVADELAQHMRESLEGLEREIKNYIASNPIGARRRRGS